MGTHHVVFTERLLCPRTSLWETGINKSTLFSDSRIGTLGVMDDTLPFTHSLVFKPCKDLSGVRVVMGHNIL